MTNGVFVERISHIEVEGCGIAIYLDNDGSLLMDEKWYNRYNPKVGDYLTQCNNGHIAVCPLHAYVAIKQVNEK